MIQKMQQMCFVSSKYDSLSCVKPGKKGDRKRKEGGGWERNKRKGRSILRAISSILHDMNSYQSCRMFENCSCNSPFLFFLSPSSPCFCRCWIIYYFSHSSFLFVYYYFNTFILCSKIVNFLFNLPAGGGAQILRQNWYFFTISHTRLQSCLKVIGVRHRQYIPSIRLPR